MGWSVSCTPGRLKDELKDRTAGWENKDADGRLQSKTTCLTSKYVMWNPGAGVLFKVMETSRYDKSGRVVVETERWIGVDLLKCYRGCWGYKDMSEQSGPNEDSCPLEYIDKLVPDKGYCKKGHCAVDPYRDKEHEKSCKMCHGCGQCWAQGWRNRVRAKAHRLQATRRFVKTLKAGDPVVIAKGWSGAGDTLRLTELRGTPAHPQIICGYTRLSLKQVDLEASVAAKTGVELEAKPNA